LNNFQEGVFQRVGLHPNESRGQLIVGDDGVGLLGKSTISHTIRTCAYIHHNKQPNAGKYTIKWEFRDSLINMEIAVFWIISVLEEPLW